MIARIDRQIVFHGRRNGPTWFQPAPCMVPSPRGQVALMTVQSISGSDYYGQAHSTLSHDGGLRWSPPAPIASAARRALPGGLEEGVCDLVPGYHPQTNCVVAIGHNVFYRSGALARPQPKRHSVFVVRDAAGCWSELRVLPWDLPDTVSYSAACSQRVMLEDGDLLVPFGYLLAGREDRAVRTVRFSFDGQAFAIRAAGAPLNLPVRRGLMEPSLARFAGRFYMTLRAEDGHGHVTVSDDGLYWAPQEAWRWENGEALTMSTTQQHWLTHSEGLFLVYTRRAPENANVFRWRAPLYLARVNPDTLRLVRDSERVVLPLIGDGLSEPQHVARMGNFQVINASPDESWVTVGETLPDDGWKGNTLLARIHWSRPNTLASA
jgi:hypothetical protein